MKVTLIERVDDKVKFSVDFSAEEFENAQIEVYKREKPKFVVDGFRKGKVPRKLIESHYGEGVFFEDAIDDLMTVAYPDSLDELGLDPIEAPGLELGEIKKGEGFSITVSVQVEPEVEVKDYKGITVKAPDNKVSEMDVDNEIETFRKRNARMVLVERAAAADDTLIIDYAGFVDDVQFEGGTAERQSLKLGSGTFIPGFEEQLLGAKPGDEVDVKVTFPEEYHSEDLAGKDAVFHCKVHEIKTEELPEVDDDLASEVSDFDSLEEWKADIREKLETAAVSKNEYDLKNAVLEKLYEANEVEVPEIMVETEVDQSIQEISQQLRTQGLNLKSYLGYMRKEENDLRDEARPDAIKRVKMRLLIKAVAAAEGIGASPEEVDQEVSDMAEQYKTDVDNLLRVMGRQNTQLMMDDIRNRKAVDFLVANAVVE